MADSEFFDLITSKEWRGGLAAILLQGEKLLSEAKDGSMGRDPYLVLEDCMARGTEIPKWLGWKILDDRKRKDDRKRGGRHTRAEERARQHADDMAALLAVKDGMLNHGLLQTPAEERAGKAMYLTRQAIHGACLREENRLRLLGLHPEEQSEKK